MTPRTAITRKFSTVNKSGTAYRGENYNISKPKIVRQSTYPNGKDERKLSREIEVSFTNGANARDVFSYGDKFQKWKEQTGAKGWSATKFHGAGALPSFIITLIEKADADNFISVDTQKSLFTADAETPQLLQNNTPQAADNFARPSQAVA